MHTKDALEYFATQMESRRRKDKTMGVTNIAELLDITTGAVPKWGDIVPKGSAETLHRISFQKIPLKFYHYER